MAEEFQAGICGETWWNNMNPTRSMFFPLMMGSTCSVAANDASNYGTNCWQSDFMATNNHHHNHSNNNNNYVVPNATSCLGFVDHKAQDEQCESDALINSTLQMMGFGGISSSSPSSNWNHHSLFNGKAENNNYNSVLEEETCLDTSCNNKSSQIQMNQQEFSGGFPIGTCVSYGYNSDTCSTTNLMQSFYEPQPHSNNNNNNNNSVVLFSNPHNNSTELSPTSTWSTTTVSSLIKQQQPPPSSSSQLNGLQFSNNTPFWNASAEALHDVRSGVFSSSSSASQPQYQTPAFENNKPNNASSTLPNKLKREKSPDKTSAVNKNGNSEPAFKRPRIETPSPLPTFKVRKEKLGDRITALQQLVSPFGKTDTASVLHEAIEYIKFLHDQVNVLSTPYMKNGAPIHHQQQGCEKVKESSEDGLRRRGLCLVPISSTFPMATETTADFWTPTFGGPLIGR